MKKVRPIQVTNYKMEEIHNASIFLKCGVLYVYSLDLTLYLFIPSQDQQPALKYFLLGLPLSLNEKNSFGFE